jgi:3D (Asp-Asp-Asp) domain-containing protein
MASWVFLYLSPAAFNFTLDAAAAANYRVDALLGNSSGTYNIFKGTESTTVAVPPTVFPVGTVLLGYVSLFGTTVTDIFAQNQLAIGLTLLKRTFIT